MTQMECAIPVTKSLPAFDGSQNRITHKYKKVVLNFSLGEERLQHLDLMRIFHEYLGFGIFLS